MNLLLIIILFLFHHHAVFVDSEDAFMITSTDMLCSTINSVSTDTATLTIKTTNTLVMTDTCNVKLTRPNVVLKCDSQEEGGLHFVCPGQTPCIVVTGANKNTLEITGCNIQGMFIVSGNGVNLNVDSCRLQGFGSSLLNPKLLSSISVRNLSTSSTVTIRRSVFFGAAFEGKEGFINAVGTIRGTIVLDNNTFHDAIYPGAGGGPITIQSDGFFTPSQKATVNIQLSSLHFVDQYAVLGKGLIVLYSAVGTANTLTAERCRFRVAHIESSRVNVSNIVAMHLESGMFPDDNVYSRGGVLHIIGSSTVGIENVEAHNVTAEADGGVIGVVNSKVTVRNVIGTRTHTRMSGGVLSVSGKSVVSAFNITGRHTLAETSGGVLFVEDMATLVVDTVSATNTTARNNGGVVLARDASVLVLSNAVAIQSSCNWHGGFAMAWFKANATFTNVTLVETRSDNHGGGFCAAGEAIVSITNLTATRTVSGFCGGVVAVLDSANLILKTLKAYNTRSLSGSRNASTELRGGGTLFCMTMNTCTFLNVGNIVDSHVVQGNGGFAFRFGVAAMTIECDPTATITAGVEDPALGGGCVYSTGYGMTTIRNCVFRRCSTCERASTIRIDNSTGNVISSIGTPNTTMNLENITYGTPSVCPLLNLDTKRGCDVLSSRTCINGTDQPTPTSFVNITENVTTPPQPINETGNSTLLTNSSSNSRNNKTKKEVVLSSLQVSLSGSNQAIAAASFVLQSDVVVASQAITYIVVSRCRNQQQHPNDDTTTTTTTQSKSENGTDENNDHTSSHRPWLSLARLMNTPSTSDDVDGMEVMLAIASLALVYTLCSSATLITSRLVSRKKNKKSSNDEHWAHTCKRLHYPELCIRYHLSLLLPLAACCTAITSPAWKVSSIVLCCIVLFLPLVALHVWGALGISYNPNPIRTMTHKSGTWSPENRLLCSAVFHGSYRGDVRGAHTWLWVLLALGTMNAIVGEMMDLSDTVCDATAIITGIVLFLAGAYHVYFRIMIVRLSSYIRGVRLMLIGVGILFVVALGTQSNVGVGMCMASLWLGFVESCVGVGMKFLAKVMDKREQHQGKGIIPCVEENHEIMLLPKSKAGDREGGEESTRLEEELNLSPVNSKKAKEQHDLL